MIPLMDRKIIQLDREFELGTMKLCNIFKNNL
jgi:hypothetical protein